MRIGGGRPARKQKFQIDPRRWRLKLHENGTQGAVAIGAGHLQLVSGNQMETHLLNVNICVKTPEHSPGKRAANVLFYSSGS